MTQMLRLSHSAHEMIEGGRPALAGRDSGAGLGVLDDPSAASGDAQRSGLYSAISRGATGIRPAAARAAASGPNGEEL
jgi:hypothetical protein